MRWPRCFQRRNLEPRPPHTVTQSPGVPFPTLAVAGGTAVPATPSTPRTRLPHSPDTPFHHRRPPGHHGPTAPGPLVPRRGQPVPPAPAATPSPGVPAARGVSVPAPTTPGPARRLNTRRYQHDCTAHTTTPRSRTTTTAWRWAVPTQRGRGAGAAGRARDRGTLSSCCWAAPPPAVAAGPGL